MFHKISPPALDDIVWARVQSKRKAVQLPHLLRSVALVLHKVYTECKL